MHKISREDRWKVCGLQEIIVASVRQLKFELGIEEWT